MRKTIKYNDIKRILKKTAGYRVFVNSEDRDIITNTMVLHFENRELFNFIREQAAYDFLLCERETISYKNFNEKCERQYNLHYGDIDSEAINVIIENAKSKGYKMSGSKNFILKFHDLIFSIKYIDYLKRAFGNLKMEIPSDKRAFYKFSNEDIKVLTLGIINSDEEYTDKFIVKAV